MTDEEHRDLQDGHDDDLRALVRAADPAASLPAADPSRVARLLEDTVADPLTDESRSDGARGRSRLTWLVAAAAAVLIAAGVLLAVTQGDDEPDRRAVDRPTSPATADAEQTVTELSVAGDPASTRCRRPQDAVDVVAAQDVAFDGVVESMSGNLVTLRPTTFYAGDATDLVVVRAPGPDLEALLAAVTFQEGGRYLVSATEGRVTLCGFTDAWSESLAGAYAEAFPG